MTYVIIVSVAIGMIGGCLIFYLLGGWLRGSGSALEKNLVGFSEKDVENLLRKTGYQIVSKKQKKTIITNVDGKDHFGYLEADYIVTKRKRKFVVLVKSGEGMADPNEPTLRRRLIEYDHVFEPDALLFIDLDKGELHPVYFQYPHERNIDFFFRFLIALFIIIVIIGIIWLLAQLHLL